MSTFTTESIGLRAKLASLWCSLMFLYLYADVFSFYRPGMIGKIQDGMMGPIAATQTSLLVASILMLIPSLMIAGSFLFSMSLTRKLHAIIGVLFTLVNVGNLVGETWLYYLTYGAVEIVITLAIVLIALRGRLTAIVKKGQAVGD